MNVCSVDLDMYILETLDKITSADSSKHLF